MFTNAATLSSIHGTVSEESASLGCLTSQSYFPSNIGGVMDYGYYTLSLSGHGSMVVSLTMVEDRLGGE